MENRILDGLDRDIGAPKGITRGGANVTNNTLRDFSFIKVGCSTITGLPDFVVGKWFLVEALNKPRRFRFYDLGIKDDGGVIRRSKSRIIKNHGHTHLVLRDQNMIDLRLYNAFTIRKPCKAFG